MASNSLTENEEHDIIIIMSTYIYPQYNLVMEGFCGEQFKVFPCQ